MRMTRVIAVLIALTATMCGHAKSAQSNDVNARDLDCLAKNIYYEAASEPEEGKVAVGIVTLNRTQDSRFPGTVCGVVAQRKQKETAHQITEITENVVYGIFRETVKTTKTVFKVVAVCQFSWQCMKVAPPKHNDARWTESLRVARELLEGGYSELKEKYAEALYFHNHRVKPLWAKQKNSVAVIGGHHFYADLR